MFPKCAGTYSEEPPDRRYAIRLAGKIRGVPKSTSEGTPNKPHLQDVPSVETKQAILPLKKKELPTLFAIIP